MYADAMFAMYLRASEPRKMSQPISVGPRFYELVLVRKPYWQSPEDPIRNSQSFRV